jgi:hypothetical protein
LDGEMMTYKTAATIAAMIVVNIVYSITFFQRDAIPFSDPYDDNETINDSEIMGMLMALKILINISETHLPMSSNIEIPDNPQITPNPIETI